MRYAWIEANRDSYSVTMMCELLSVSRSGLHDARQREPSARATENARIVMPVKSGEYLTYGNCIPDGSLIVTQIRKRLDQTDARFHIAS